MKYLQGLNDVQQQALLHTEGAVLVTAGAGSGKTRLLTNRISYLLGEKKVNGSNILAITFTNKAAREMKERVEMLVGANNVWISTFHSMCVRILRQDISRLEGYENTFTIYSEAESQKVLKDTLKQFGLNNDKLKQFAWHISNLKNKNQTIKEYMQPFQNALDEDLEKVYVEYQKKLNSFNALDFDDLLVVTYKLLNQNQDILSYYANRFKYVLVDEVQDTNTVQYDLLRLLTSVHKNIFAVGDEDQSIYSWRGANFKNIFNFKKDYDNLKLFKLEQNYRSTQNILNTANKLISNNEDRFDKKLWTENEEGRPVEYFDHYDERTEADSISSKIYALIKNGYNLNDIAILYRMNALSFPFEQSLLSYNLPYKIFGGFKFFERAEIKNIIAYLSIFVNPKDEVSLLKIINFPKRGIGDVAVEKVKDTAAANNMGVLEYLEYVYETKADSATLNKFNLFLEPYFILKEKFKKNSLYDFVCFLITEFKIRSAFPKDSEENENKQMNIDMFQNAVKDFCDKNESPKLADFLESITLESDIEAESLGSNHITLATVHAVKGLEFKVVFVVGLEEGIFPISRAFDSISEMEEERRLMYVAMTRAMQRLILSSCKTRFTFGKRNYMDASRFLYEIEVTKSRVKAFSNNYQILNQPTFAPDASKFNIIKPTVEIVNLETKRDPSIYCIGQIVGHPKFGVGEIKTIDSSGKCADILFTGFGIKTLMLEIAPLKILKNNGGKNE